MEKMLKIVENKNTNSPCPSATPPSPKIFVSPATEPKPSARNAVKAPTPLLETPPRQNSSIQSTPAKDLPTKSDNLVAAPTWHLEAERLFADAEVDVSLDVDDFEALCNDLFNTPATGKGATGNVGTWGCLPPTNQGVVDSGITTGSPRKRAQSTTVTATAGPPPAGLGLSLVTTSG